MNKIYAGGHVVGHNPIWNLVQSNQVREMDNIWNQRAFPSCVQRLLHTRRIWWGRVDIVQNALGSLVNGEFMLHC